jgi:hypothetical protein
LAFPIVRTQTSLTFVPASEAPWLTDGFPVPEGVAYRVPAYVVAGDFASGPYQRAYGVDWSGGELSFEIDGSNAQMFLSDASGRLLYFQRSEPGGRLVTLPLPAGLYVVVVEPERPPLPAAGFRLSVGAPH